MSRYIGNREINELEHVIDNAKKACEINNSLHSCFVFKSGKKRKGESKVSREVHGKITENKDITARRNGCFTYGV